MLKQTESKSKSIDTIRHSDYIVLMKALEIIKPFCETSKPIEVIGTGIAIPMGGSLLFTTVLSAIGEALVMLKAVNILLFITIDRGVLTINIHGDPMKGMGTGRLEWKPDYY